MPQGYKELKERMMVDPSNLHFVPLNVWTYSSIADKEFYQYMVCAGEVIRMDRSVGSGNPALKKIQQMEKDEAAGE